MKPVRQGWDYSIQESVSITSASSDLSLGDLVGGGLAQGFLVLLLYKISVVVPQPRLRLMP